ncbi:MULTISPECIES: DUF1190 domain-containing protein [unclassified Halomonas]|uniref:DUF1190 domain-containing protein n=1 Tax=unclassified Halomonas TaxID=2609666 RepID=UPI0020A05404|nr:MULTISPECIES: DUF1190 domain-containing protein [unclassified Halomonas]MCP1312829.1 DUF1190 domain-containing protein [Halomonas sp. 707D7]MCP1326482.1 DUF1190 domain-containing protein [Halomonas sp. 707D4]
MTRDDQPSHLPHRKRSLRLSLALMGAGAFTLTGCGQSEEVTDVSFDSPKSFQSVEECVAANVYTESACEEAYQASIKEVPRFDSLEACEAEHGEGACVAPTEEQAQAATGTSGGSWFMPALMGYMVGNMMSRTSRGATRQGLYQEPVYRNRQNQGNWNAATNQASQRVSQRQQTMRNVATQNRQATQRSGFGSRSSARGGWGS